MDPQVNPHPVIKVDIEINAPQLNEINGVREYHANNQVKSVLNCVKI